MESAAGKYKGKYKGVKHGNGQVRIGRCIFQSAGGYQYPSYPGFTPIVVLTKSSEYGMLGPYCLSDNQGRIMENIWQFSKVYPWVPEVKIPYTVRYPKIVWTWPEEVHVNAENVPNETYWKWREAGMRAPDPVRYPVGRDHAKYCLYALKGRGGRQIDYADARREIYLAEYTALVQDVKEFNQLQDRLEEGENLLIIETDGPHQESVDYYTKKYGTPSNFIENGTVLATRENLRILLEDTKHPFGHGYCLASALLNYVI